MSTKHVFCRHDDLAAATPPPTPQGCANASYTILSTLQRAHRANSKCHTQRLKDRLSTDYS